VIIVSVFGHSINMPASGLWRLCRVMLCACVWCRICCIAVILNFDWLHPAACHTRMML